HLAAAGGAAVCFGFGNQSRTEPLLLACRVDRQHAEIAPLAVHLNVDGAGEAASVLEHEELPAAHPAAHVVGIRAIAVLEEILDTIGTADERRQRRGVGGCRDSELHRAVYPVTAYYQEVDRV